MAQEIAKFDLNVMLENSSNVKEESQEDEYYPYNKVWVSETNVTNTINISNTEMNEYIKNDKYETLSVDYVKPNLPSSEINDTVSNNVKIENAICPANIKIEFCNEMLFCKHCHEVYQDYCTECRVLVHILNQRPAHNIYDRMRELPKYMLEARESIGHLGIFTLKVIPEDVKFGPFSGLNSTGVSLRIKGERFVLSDDQSEHLNWMQYIASARNIYEQNLFPFQHEGKLYYSSTRRIQEGEELLVYFSEKFENKLLENMEIVFVPIIKEDVENVFACTFCCLGFSSKEYLAEHKAVCYSQTNKRFSVEELAQCPLCKIYLEAKEYFEHHQDYCSEAHDRHCVLSSRVVHKMKVKTRSSLGSKAKRRKRGTYKCRQCKFRTKYNAEFRHHTNEHYWVKMYKCGICNRRYKMKESLKTHVEKIHVHKNIKEKSGHSHDEKQCESLKCKFQTRSKCRLKPLIEMKYLNRAKYKCENCEFKTYYRIYLEMHMKIKHFMEINDKCMECEYKTSRKSDLKRRIKTKHHKLRHYKCMDCEYQTNSKSNLERHIKTKHLKLRNYKCMECEYHTSSKSNLERHIKTRHLKLSDYKCMECEYQTNVKSNLEKHIKTKHLKSSDYKCMECEYQTNFKLDLERHIKTRHLKLNDYKCIECEYQTNFKSNLEKHIKSKHLKSSDHKCMECEYQTNFKSNLGKHIKSKHLKSSDYKCLECEYQTNFKVTLERHVKIKHLKSYDYKCVECEYQTNFKSQLETHIKSKHLKLWDYKCMECEYMTNYKSDLVKHMKAKHYKCMECEYKANRKANLERHVKAKHIKGL